MKFVDAKTGLTEITNQTIRKPIKAFVLEISDATAAAFTTETVNIQITSEDGNPRSICQPLLVAELAEIAAFGEGSNLKEPKKQAAYIPLAPLGIQLTGKEEIQFDFRGLDAAMTYNAWGIESGVSDGDIITYTRNSVAKEATDVQFGVGKRPLFLAVEVSNALSKVQLFKTDLRTGKALTVDILPSEFQYIDQHLNDMVVSSHEVDALGGTGDFINGYNLLYCIPLTPDVDDRGNQISVVTGGTVVTDASDGVRFYIMEVASR